jgi:hypothetical protein
MTYGPMSNRSFGGTGEDIEEHVGSNITVLVLKKL